MKRKILSVLAAIWLFSVSNIYAELITNGDFSNGITGWYAWTYTSGGKTADFNVVGGELFVNNINGGGVAGWVSILNSSVSLVQGTTYTVFFDARSTAARSITVGPRRGGPGDYTSYSFTEVLIDDTMKTYSFSYTHTAESDTSAQLIFLLGKTSDPVYLDNVSMVEFIGPYNPYPPDFSADTAIDMDLSWSIPSSHEGALSNLYFGTSPNPPLVSSEQTDTTYDPGTLQYLTDYYWRIDLVHEGNTYRGAEWTFKTASQSEVVTTDLQGMIDDQLALGYSTVTIDPGRYYVAPSSRKHLLFQNLNDVTIVMDGVEMVCTETTQAIRIEDCTNLRIQGLTIDYDPLPYTQGYIQSMTNNNTEHTIELFGGYPDSEGVIDSKYEIFDPTTRTLRCGTYFTFTHEKVDSRHIRVIREGTYKGEQVGDIIVINNKYAPGGSIPHGILMQDSEGVTLQDITLYGSNCFGFFETNCNGTHYLRCKVDRRPAAGDLKVRQDPRIRSLDADAFHSKHAIVGPTLEGCTAKFQGDDCVNICGEYHMIMACNGQTLRVLAKGSSMNIHEGDPVELWTYTGLRLPDAVAVSVSGPVGEATADELKFLSQQKMHSTYKEGNIGSAYEIQIDCAIDMPMGSLIAAANRMGNGFQVINCDFGFNRSRGILIKASNGIVQGNVIEGSWGEAIKCSPEFWWLESGSSWNVTFSDNIIKNCVGDGIAVYAKPGAGGLAPAGAHGDIVLRNNTITNVGDPHIWITSTKGLILDGNTYDTILLENCEEVTLAADFNDDGEVDLWDLETMAANWLQAVHPECPQCDMNGDGDVNLEDYSVLSKNWLNEF